MKPVPIIAFAGALLVAAFALAGPPPIPPGAPVTLPFVTPENYGAYGDLQQSTAVVTATASNCAITISGGSFTSADQGKVFESSGLGATYTYGGIASVAVSTPGALYTSQPSISVSGGTGAYLQPLMTVVNALVATGGGGSGYANGTQNLTLAGSIPGQVFTVNVTASGGAITSVNSIMSGGQYPHIPGTTSTTNIGYMTAAMTGGTGTGAQLDLDWGLGAVNVVSLGVNYPTSGATVTISGGVGGGAAAAAATNGNSISGNSVSLGGQGYYSAPTATYSGGDGTGAVAGAVTVTSGAVTAVAVSSAGSGVAVNPPAIVFTSAAPSSPATFGAVSVTPYVAPLSTTIASVQSATQITLASCPVSSSSASQSMDWGHDDTTAVQAALNASKRVNLPGSYLITNTVSVLSGTILGNKALGSGLYGSVSMPMTSAVLAVGRTTDVGNLGVHYVGPAITDTETQGQRVAISTAGVFELQRGSFLHNIQLSHVGTGVYDGTSVPFSATFTAFEITDYSYRGWDFQSANRTGNVYQNIYVVNGRTNADRGFSLAGGETESSLDQINVEHSVLNTPMYLGQVKALSAGTLHFEGDWLRAGYTGYVKFEDTSGNVNALSLFNTRMNDTSPLGVELGNSTESYSFTSDWNTNRIQIGVLQAEGLNYPSSPPYTTYAQTGLTGVYNFALVGRTLGATGYCTLAVNSYVWLSYISTDVSLNTTPVINAASEISVERFATTSSSVVGNAPYSLQAADGTAAGGNTRGSYATDLQRSRALATQVASGNGSVIAGGANNISSGVYSITAGYYSTASGSYSTAFGGSNVASGSYSVVPGGQFGFDRGAFSSSCFASGRIAVLGDAQECSHVLRAATTDATPTRTTADGSAASTSNSVPLPAAGLSYRLTGSAVSVGTATGTTAGWAFTCLIKNVSGTVTLLGSTVTKDSYSDSGASAWTLALAADATNKSLSATVTGAASTTIHTVLRVDTIEAQ